MRWLSGNRFGIAARSWREWAVQRLRAWAGGVSLRSHPPDAPEITRLWYRCAQPPSTSTAVNDVSIFVNFGIRCTRPLLELYDMLCGIEQFPSQWPRRFCVIRSCGRSAGFGMRSLVARGLGRPAMAGCRAHAHAYGPAAVVEGAMKGWSPSRTGLHIPPATGHPCCHSGPGVRWPGAAASGDPITPGAASALRHQGPGQRRQPRRTGRCHCGSSGVGATRWLIGTPAAGSRAIGWLLRDGGSRLLRHQPHGS